MEAYYDNRDITMELMVPFFISFFLLFLLLVYDLRVRMVRISELYLQHLLKLSPVYFSGLYAFVLVLKPYPQRDRYWTLKLYAFGIRKSFVEVLCWPLVYVYRRLGKRRSTGLVHEGKTDFIFFLPDFGYKWISICVYIHICTCIDLVVDRFLTIIGRN